MGLAKTRSQELHTGLHEVVSTSSMDGDFATTALMCCVTMLALLTNLVNTLLEWKC